MVFNNNFQDNLMVSRSGGRRRRGVVVVTVILILLSLIIISRRANLFNREAADPSEEQVVQEAEQLDAGHDMLQKMRVLVADKALLAAREAGYKILESSRNRQVLDETENLLGKINIQMVETPLDMPEKQSHIVKSGDSLERIARSYGTTVELLRKSNSLKRDVIHPGDVLRVFNGVFALKVNKARNDMVLEMNDRFFKRYRVGTGKHGTTPAGVFQIADKIVEPPWWRPDGNMFPFGHEENVLGTRWMSITAIEETPNVRGYGIHGTWEPETIGHQESQGCIRMVNSDVEELFMLVPLGIRVVIVE